jgi:hypothetical protein
MMNCVKLFINHPSIFFCFGYNDKNMKTLHLVGITMSIILIIGNIISPHQATRRRRRRRQVGTITTNNANTSITTSTTSRNMMVAVLIVATGLIFAYYNMGKELLEESKAVMKIGFFLLLFIQKFSLKESTSTILLFGLWISYFTIVTSANSTSFYQYGWESQLLETGFLAIFLCRNFWPTTSTTTGSTTTGSTIGSTIESESSSSELSSSPIVLWLFRWLSYRISIGAGLIKIRGDSCWTNKTCLLYHFETQPIPNPISFIFHFLPPTILKYAIDLDLFVQVYTSWLVLLPTKIILFLPASSSSSSWTNRMNKILLNLVRLGGYIQIGFMINIAISGNMSMLNHLTIIPSIACLDDLCYPYLIRNYYLGDDDGDDNDADNDEDTNTKQQQQQQQQSQQQMNIDPLPSLPYWRWNNIRMYIDIILLILILVLSRPVVENLLQLNGRKQSMNASFDNFRLVNTYGAFGSVGKKRYEPIISIAYNKNNEEDEDEDESIEWIEIEFPCKPGTISRRPCFCAPYHYRIDWNIWFIGFEPHKRYLNQRESWLYSLIIKILEEQPTEEEEGAEQQQQQRRRPWLDLLDVSSAELLQSRGHPPLYAKVDMYHYEMANPLWTIISQYINNTIMRIRSSDSVDGNGDGDATTKNNSYNEIVWWNRYYKENLIPIISYNQKQKQLYRVQ